VCLVSCLFPSVSWVRKEGISSGDRDWNSRSPKCWPNLEMVGWWALGVFFLRMEFVVASPILNCLGDFHRGPLKMFFGILFPPSTATLSITSH
jgi:hypothetical protein